MVFQLQQMYFVSDKNGEPHHKNNNFPSYNSTPLIWWLPILSIVFQLVYFHPICEGGHTKVGIINEIQLLLGMNFMIN